MPAGCQCEFSLRLSRCVCVVLPSVCQCVRLCVWMCAYVCVLVAFQLCTDMLAFQRWAHLCLRITDQSYARMNLIRLQTTTQQAHLGPLPTNAIANANLLIDSRQRGSSEVQLKMASIYRETHHRQPLNDINMQARQSLRYNVGTFT